jgi:hypothetical protein
MIAGRKRSAITRARDFFEERRLPFCRWARQSHARFRNGRRAREGALTDAW